MKISLVCAALLLAWTLIGTAAPQDKAAVAPPGPFRFTDASAAAGLEQPLHGAFVHGIAWGDFDDDGRLDLFVGTFADRSPRFGQKQVPPNRLFRQVAGGKFELFPCPVVEAAMRCSGAVFVDLNNTGRLDLFVTSNTLTNVPEDLPRRAPKVMGSKLYRNDGKGQFVDLSQQCGACPPDLVRCRDIGVFDYDGDGLLDLLILQDKGTRPDDKLPGVRLFRNLGNYRFEEVTRKVGLPDDLWGAGVAVADLNGDGRPDFYLCGCNRLYLSQADKTYKEAVTLRPLFNPPEKDLDWVTGASFGDLNRDGNLDLITGRHHYHGPSRVHVFLNEGLKAGVPQFREITRDLGIPALPQKAPHPEIQDFDNDGLPDLYWSAFFAEGTQRSPFLCKGLGVRDGLPRFAIPEVPTFDLERVKTNEPPAKGVGMIYYVNGPAVDYDGDGKLDFFCGIWPTEPSRLFRNETQGGNWLQVRVKGKKMNRMGLGAQVRLYAAGKVGEPDALLGYQQITVNGGYSSGRPALVHFGLGKPDTCDLEVTLPSRSEPVILRKVKGNRLLTVEEP